MTDKSPIPPRTHAVGDPRNGYVVSLHEEEWLGTDFYKHVDEAFDSWYDSERARSNLGSCMPVELTALEPEARPVAWKGRKRHREDRRAVHPEVAAEMERLEAMDRPSREDCAREFSPSPLAIYRAGFSAGVQAQRGHANVDWATHLEKYHDGRDGWAVNAIKRTIRAQGLESVHELLDQIVAELEAEVEIKPPKRGGLAE